MDEVRPRLEEDPKLPEDSVLPRKYESFTEWDLRITQMLNEFRARKRTH